MPKRGRAPLRRTEHYIAIRAVAVKAARAAFPAMTATEIGDALGLSRDMVKHYLLGGVKAADHREPAWAAEFFAACRLLTNTTQPGRAAMAFDAFARRLHALAREDREAGR